MDWILSLDQTLQCAHWQRSIQTMTPRKNLCVIVASTVKVMNVIHLDIARCTRNKPNPSGFHQKETRPNRVARACFNDVRTDQFPDRP